jgi:hypothetical protein
MQTENKQIADVIDPKTLPGLLRGENAIVQTHFTNSPTAGSFQAIELIVGLDGTGFL